MRHHSVVPPFLARVVFVTLLLAIFIGPMWA